MRSAAKIAASLYPPAVVVSVDFDKGIVWDQVARVRIGGYDAVNVKEVEHD